MHSHSLSLMAAGRKRWVQDAPLFVASALAAAVVVGLFGWLLADMLGHGLQRLSLSFLTQPPINSGREGGIGSLIVSTALILMVALVVTVPLALGAAVWLHEFVRKGHASARFARASVDMLAGVPSIVMGLFGNAFFCVLLGLGFSILSGGLTLACMMLPIVIRTTEQGLGTVPKDWRSGAAALGMTRAAALWHILLPAAAPAITAGLILATGRALAETAALIFTSGYVDRMPESLLDSGRALAVHIYDLSMNVSGGDASAYATGLVLVGALLLINAAALWLSDRYFAKRIHAQ